MSVSESMLTLSYRGERSLTSRWALELDSERRKRARLATNTVLAIELKALTFLVILYPNQDESCFSGFQQRWHRGHNRPL